MEAIASPESVGLSSTRLKRIHAWMQKYLDQKRLPGATTLVARQGQVVYCESLGYRDLETRQPMTPDTILRIYSMTKPITSVAAMMLYEEGYFQLDDPVAEFIPSFKDLQVYVSGTGDKVITEPLNRPMTIHDLLTHTSGLIYGFGDSGPLPELYKQSSTDFGTHDGKLADVVERLSKIPLSFQPGMRWNYGVSTDVLGRLVEIVSGRSLDDFLQNRILEPLNMQDTGFAIPAAKVDRLSALYECIQEDNLFLLESPRNSPLIDTVQTFSGGSGLVSTLGDYFRFTELLRRKGELDGVRLLGCKTLAYMTRNHLPGDLAAMGQPTFNETTYAGIGFGLGFSVMLDPVKAGVIGSPGEYAWGGYASTAFWIDPLEDLTVIFLTQLIPSSAYPIRRELRVLTYQAIIE